MKAFEILKPKLLTILWGKVMCLGTIHQSLLTAIIFSKKELGLLHQILNIWYSLEEASMCRKIENLKVVISAVDSIFLKSLSL